MSNRRARNGNRSGEPEAERQRSLLLAMLEGSFYPTEPVEVAHLETHISHLFLAGELAYKVKKAVRYPFVNYSTLAKRKHYLYEELRLNRRLAPSVYLGVLPISHVGKWKLGDDSRPVEYALVMRRLPSNRMLDFLIEREQVTGEMISRLAEFLSAFYAEAQTGADIDAFGHPDAVWKAWRENLRETRELLAPLDGAARFDALFEFGRTFVTEQREILGRRVKEGRIREGHGDLRCEHICLAPEGIQIFDCVEFSRELRCCDTASELAFLVMDMELRNASPLARQFIDRFQRLSHDADLLRLLPFYKCHRALVRAKVAALQSRENAALARRYFDYACRMPWETLPPLLAVLCGLPGAGKSTVARELGKRTGWTVISSDATRKSLAGLTAGSTRSPFEKGIYRPSMTEITYTKLLKDAETRVLGGQAAILDATFHRRLQRDRLRRMAEARRIPLFFIFCASPEEIIRERLRLRAVEARDLSDAGWEVYLGQKSALEPLEEIAPENILRLDTNRTVGEAVRLAEQFLRERSARGGA